MVKHGVDGSESHSVSNLRSQTARDHPPFFLLMVSPLELKDREGLNDNSGLKKFSEEGLEQAHKLIPGLVSIYRENQNRFQKCKTFSRIYVVGEQVLNEKFRKCLKCKKCGELGHQRGCKANLICDSSDINSIVKHLSEVTDNI
ncbi:hypothetical protein LOD99_1493 [Oopsacas minuta]|uniref:Uncharacterized protein n=1 Tax=Oopsacas minuta TaxID=111878 RepID=A0AAV7K519_9METZ|nr:hypothetical protein LOD99_1493 [Oopsacas minuta]